MNMASHGAELTPLPPLSPITPATPIQVRVPESFQPLVEVAASPAPVPQEWVMRVTQACVEVIIGHRSAQQLSSMCTAHALKQLKIRSAIMNQKRVQRSQWRLASVRALAVNTTAIEISATLLIHHFAVPLAIRLDQVGDEWTIAAMEMGPI